jgi:hypothetical protein
LGIAFVGGIEFFWEGLRLLLPVVAAFVAAPGCWVQPLLRIPGPAGPAGAPMPVDVLPVPALPWAKALSGKMRTAIDAIAIIDFLAIAFSLPNTLLNLGKLDSFLRNESRSSGLNPVTFITLEIV